MKNVMQIGVMVDAYLEPSRTYMMELFSHKSSIIDVQLSSKYASVMLKDNAMQ